MAYGLKYELLCTSKKGNAYKLKLSFDGYAGAEVNRNIPGDSPFVLRKDKAAYVSGTSLDYSIREEVDFELYEFYANNPKKIKAQLYAGTVLIWAGYNVAQQYEADYIRAPQTVRFTATDGLGLLKNEKFTLTGTNTQLETIIYCIDKIGLGLGYSIAINLFETNHVTNRSSLAQTDEDAYVFNNLDCYTVIEKILNKYDAEITQVNGRWYITRSTDKKSTRMLYTSAGVYETTEAAPAVLDLGFPSTAGVEVWPIGRLRESREPGAKKVTIKHDFGRKNSLLNNYEFWRYAGGQFTGWTQTGSFTLSQRIKGGKPYALLAGYSADATHKISQEIPIADIAGDDFVFEIDFAPIGRAAGSINGISSIMMTVKMLVAVGNGTTNWYLTKTGWVTTLTYIEETVSASLVSPVWTPFKIIADGLPCDGNIHVSLFRYYLSGSPRPGDSYTGIAFSEPRVYFLHDGELYPSGIETVASFDNSTEPGDLGTVDLLTADAPDYLNKGQLYENITRLAITSEPTKDWVNSQGVATPYSQLVQLVRTYASNNRIARQKLTGVIKASTTLSFNLIVKHAYNSNREFELSEVQWDLFNESYQVTMLELLAWSNETITFTTTSDTTSSVARLNTGSAVTGVPISNDGGSNVLKYFEIVNAGASDEYLRCKLPIGCDYEIQAFTNSGQMTSLWAAMPVASDTVLGGVKVGSGLQISAGVLSVTAGGGMVYPGAGIALSTGSAWGSPITNNSASWNTAFGWGNHAGLYTPVAHNTNYSNPHSVTASQVGLGNVTNESKAVMFNSPTFTGTVSGITAAMVGAMSTSHAANAITGTNITNWNTAYSWGNHASAGYAPLASPTFTGTVTTNGGISGTGFSGNAYPYNTILGSGADVTWSIMKAGSTAGQMSWIEAYGGGNGSYPNIVTIGTASVERMRILANGNVGIGTTDPAGYKLNVNGTGYFASNVTVAGNVTATGEVTAYYSSDRRLKQNINYQFSGLDMIDRMKPATYNWNSTMMALNSAKDYRTNYGMIADEMANVAPELIHKIYEKYDAVDYIQVIPILVKAVQELRAEVKFLRS